jgi:maltose O-acetyltransferase
VIRRWRHRLYDYLVGFSLLIAFLVGRVPVLAVRHFVYKRLGMTIGPNSTVHWRLVPRTPHNITIGCNTIIGNDAFIDGRYGVTIGDNVNMGDHVSLYTAAHDPQSVDFGIKYGPIDIGDRVYLGARVIVLQNITIGEGAVAAAGSVVTRDVEPYTIVAGVPAKKIGDRRRDLDYTLKYHLPFQ